MGLQPRDGLGGGCPSICACILSSGFPPPRARASPRGSEVGVVAAAASADGARLHRSGRWVVGRRRRSPAQSPTRRRGCGRAGPTAPAHLAADANAAAVTAAGHDGSGVSGFMGGRGGGGGGGRGGDTLAADAHALCASAVTKDGGSRCVVGSTTPSGGLGGDAAPFRGALARPASGRWQAGKEWQSADLPSPQPSPLPSLLPPLFPSPPPSPTPQPPPLPLLPFSRRDTGPRGGLVPGQPQLAAHAGVLWVPPAAAGHHPPYWQSVPAARRRCMVALPAAAAFPLLALFRCTGGVSTRPFALMSPRFCSKR